MDVVITSRHCELSERFRDHVEEKLDSGRVFLFRAVGQKGPEALVAQVALDQVPLPGNLDLPVAVEPR